MSLRDKLAHFTWFNKPEQWDLEDYLDLTTEPDTDYWQRTHYGFRRDNGHFFYTPHTGDFTLTARLAFWPTAQYDQCGLMVRAEAEQWIKCSVEYETPAHSRLGSVVTNFGYSDWATQDIASTQQEMWYRFSRRGEDFLIEWAAEDQNWHQMRITHLHQCPAEVQVGMYACSPVGAGFTCRLLDLELGPNRWLDS